MRDLALSVLATAAVCVAGALVFDRFLPFTYPESVTMPILLLHNVNVALAAIYMQYCFQQKHAFGKTILHLLPAFFLPTLVDTLIDMPSKGMPKGYLLHEIGFMALSMIVFSLFWRPAPPPMQAP